MLDLHFYRNVPFQSDYANIILFSDKAVLKTYLSTYQIGVLNDVAMYWYNGNQIELDTIYEDANYLWIHDTNAVIPDKFYFIESIENESASSGKYNLTCDIWHTYSYDMQLKPSLCVNGHAEVIAPSKQYYLSDYVPKYEYYLNTANDAAGNKLLKSVAEATDGRMTAMAIVTFEASADYGTTIIFSREKFNANTSYEEILWTFLGNLMTNKASSLDTNGDILHTYTFKIERVYLIPDFIMFDVLEAMQEATEFPPYSHEAFVPYETILLGNALAEFNTDINHCYMYHPNYIISDADEPLKRKYLPYLKIEMASAGAFDISKIKPNAKYILGTLTNAVEIHAAQNSNFNMKLNMFITESNGLSIFIEASNKMINITNDFEIPFVNDNYTLYMATNQATIDASNKNATIQLATSMTMAAAGIAAAYFSGGASLALVGGAISAGAGFVQNRIKQNATLEDAKKIIGKNDGVYAGGGVTINYGVGVFEYISNDNYAAEYMNNFGNSFNAIIDEYRFFEGASYNFYYIKFGEVNITGNFNNGIKKQLESILLNGVRLWLDSSKFLQNVPYKKP